MANTTPRRVVVRRRPKTQETVSTETASSSTAPSPTRQNLDPVKATQVTVSRDREMDANPAYTWGPPPVANYTGKDRVKPGTNRYTVELDEGMMSQLYHQTKNQYRQSMQSQYDRLLPEFHGLTMRMLNECFRAWCVVHGDPPPPVRKVVRRRGVPSKTPVGPVQPSKRSVRVRTAKTPETGTAARRVVRVKR